MAALVHTVAVCFRDYGGQGGKKVSEGERRRGDKTEIQVFYSTLVPLWVGIRAWAAAGQVRNSTDLCVWYGIMSHLIYSEINAPQSVLS